VLKHLPRWLGAPLAAGLVVASAGSPQTAAADPVPQEGRPPTPLGTDCEVWEVDYALVDGTRLRISDTFMKAGDGTYDVGPGKVKIRFQDAGGKPGPGTAELLQLKVVTKFTVVSNVVGMKTKVETDAVSRNTPGKCGVIAKGKLEGNKVSWLGPAHGYRSDGTLHCEGTMCGKMGAPPRGASPVKIGPYPVNYQAFLFGDGVKKLLMPFAEVARSDKPKQVTHLQLVGVETRRECVKKPACK